MNALNHRSIYTFYFLSADYNTSEQKQACKKHELYVSFRDLGWQVGAMINPILDSKNNNNGNWCLGFRRRDVKHESLQRILKFGL